MDFNQPTQSGTGAKRVHNHNSSSATKTTTPWAGTARSVEPVVTKPPVERKTTSSGVKPSVKRRKPRRVLKTILVCLLLIGILAGAWFGYQKIAYVGIDTSRYQAVYLDNDDVYFGKVQKLLNGDILLNDVFRVQAAPVETAKTPTSSTDTASTGSTQQSSEIRLIKPGKELHAPDDTMLINTGKVRFIENIGNKSSVAKAINDYRDGND